MIRRPGYELLSLAVGTIVSAAASYNDAPNRCPAYQTWLAGAEIYPMLELEKAFYAGCVHIIGDRRAAQRDCLFEDNLQAVTQAVKFRAL